MSIEIVRIAQGEPLRFRVTIRDNGGETRHDVSLRAEDLSRLAPSREAEALIDAAFRFLLDHEPKESILPRFDLSVISRYFPQFERVLPTYLSG